MRMLDDVYHIEAVFELWQARLVRQSTEEYNYNIKIDIDQPFQNVAQLRGGLAVSVVVGLVSPSSTSYLTVLR
jgi:hypothetical protein